MSIRTAVLGLVAKEDINFLLTNRIPRLALTRFMGWFSKVENPLVAKVSIALWRFFCDVDLTDSGQGRFPSLHAAFVRRLKADARTIDTDPAVLVAPCDAILGAFGQITKGQALQIKGFPYSLADLLGDEQAACDVEGGWFVTMRLTAGMYHRFHAPHDLTVEQVRYISGDTWNVNPIALKRIERLFCKNERAPITARLDVGGEIIMVAVAAVLVASIRLPFLDLEHGVRAAGEGVRSCSARFAKGDEIGWFEHGSTIVLLAPAFWRPAGQLEEGALIRLGQPLLETNLERMNGDEASRSSESSSVR